MLGLPDFLRAILILVLEVLLKNLKDRLPAEDRRRLRAHNTRDTTNRVLDQDSDTTRTANRERDGSNGDEDSETDVDINFDGPPYSINSLLGRRNFQLPDSPMRPDREHQRELGYSTSPSSFHEDEEEPVIYADPRICHVCASTLQPLTGKHIKRADPGRVSTYLDFLQRVEDGCRICKLFNVRLNHKASKGTLSNIEKGSVTVRRENPGEKGRPPCLKLWLRSGVLEETASLNFELDDGSNKLLPNRIGRYTNGNASLYQVQKWLQNCKNHQSCQPGRFHAARIIEVTRESNNAETIKVRLLRRSQLPKAARYMTLSHCWGTSTTPLKLLGENLQSWQSQIPYDKLPKTFQQALDVVLFLDEKYIWIDSLCIIQDSLEDWRAQSLCMGLVYENSYLNISATAAENGIEGLSNVRDVDTIRRTKIALGERAGCDEGIYNVYSPRAFQDGVNEAPLNTRAWVLQERMLSKRNLHFADDQLFWECRELTACESFPDHLPHGMTNTNRKRELVQYLDSSQHSTHTLSLHQIQQDWADLVETYTDSDLTFPTDRLIAISGLASKFSAAIANSSSGSVLAQKSKGSAQQYLAGLWNFNLTSQLLWKVESLHDPSPVSKGQVKQYVAPTWSWASLEASFSSLWKLPYSGFLGVTKDVVSVTSVHVVNAAAENIYGQVTGGELKLTGRLAATCRRRGRGLVRVDTSSWHGKGLVGDMKPLNLEFGGDGHEKEEEDEDKYFLPPPSPFSLDKHNNVPSMMTLHWDNPPSKRNAKSMREYDSKDGLLFFLPIRVRASDAEKLERISTLLLSRSSARDQVELDTQEAADDFRGAYLEGLILKETAAGKGTSMEIAQESKLRLPAKFQRVGKWETLAARMFVREIWSLNDMLTEYGDIRQGMGYEIVIE